MWAGFTIHVVAAGTKQHPHLTAEQIEAIERGKVVLREDTSEAWLSPGSWASLEADDKR